MVNDIEKDTDFSTETRVKVESLGKKKILNRLFDSGASGTHIKRRALRMYNTFSPK